MAKRTLLPWKLGCYNGGEVLLEFLLWESQPITYKHLLILFLVVFHCWTKIKLSQTCLPRLAAQKAAIATYRSWSQPHLTSEHHCGLVALGSLPVWYWICYQQVKEFQSGIQTSSLPSEEPSYRHITNFLCIPPIVNILAVCLAPTASPENQTLLKL